MATSDSRWTEVSALADQVLQLARQQARAGFEIPTHYLHIVGMFWRSVRLYDGVLVLLKAELPEESAFLARSLFEVSLQLQQLHAEPASRDALVLGWISQSLKEKRGLLEVAKATGIDDDIQAELAKLHKQHEGLRSYADRHGVKRFESFRSVKDAAVRFGRKDDYWTYEWCHESVHGSDAAWIFARRDVAPDLAGLHAKTADPKLRSSFAHFAAKSLADGTEATLKILSWACPVELQETVRNMERILDAALTAVLIGSVIALG